MLHMSSFSQLTSEKEAFDFGIHFGAESSIVEEFPSFLLSKISSHSPINLSVLQFIMTRSEKCICIGKSQINCSWIELRSRFNESGEVAALSGVQPSLKTGWLSRKAPADKMSALLRGLNMECVTAFPEESMVWAPQQTALPSMVTFVPAGGTWVGAN